MMKHVFQKHHFGFTAENRGDTSLEIRWGHCENLDGEDETIRRIQGWGKVDGSKIYIEG